VAEMRHGSLLGEIISLLLPIPAKVEKNSSFPEIKAYLDVD